MDDRGIISEKIPTTRRFGDGFGLLRIVTKIRNAEHVATKMMTFAIESNISTSSWFEVQGTKK
jgi:hypothetical protein